MLRTGANEKLEGGKVKGSMLRSRFEWLSEHHPDLERDELIKSLPVETSALLSRGILSSGWYPFAALIHLDGRLHELFKSEKPDIIQEFGRYSAIKNLKTVISTMTIHDFFRSSVKLHDRFQDFGSADYEQITDTSGKMTYLDYACYSPAYCESAFGFFNQCIEMFGGKSPRVAEPQCHCRGDSRCTFSMSWS